MTKKKAKKDLKKRGPKEKMTKTVVNKLEFAFLRGCNDTQACLYAGISRETFYKYIKKNPKFSDRKEDLKQNPRLQAKFSVFEKIGKDQTGKFDLEYLKSTDEEFNPNKKVEVEDKASNICLIAKKHGSPRWHEKQKFPFQCCKESQPLTSYR